MKTPDARRRSPILLMILAAVALAFVGRCEYREFARDGIVRIDPQFLGQPEQIGFVITPRPRRNPPPAARPAKTRTAVTKNPRSLLHP